MSCDGYDMEDDDNRPSGAVRVRVEQILDELDVDGNIGYDYGSVGSLVTRLVCEIERLEDELRLVRKGHR